EGQALLRALGRLQEVDRQRVGQVAAAHPELMEIAATPAETAPLPGTGKHVGEDVGRIETSIGTISSALRAAGIGAIERVVSPLLPRGVDLAAVETGALVRIRQQVIGAGNVLELGRRLGAARIEVRMMLFGQLAVGLFDLVRAGGFRAAEDFV